MSQPMPSAAHPGTYRGRLHLRSEGADDRHLVMEVAARGPELEYARRLTDEGMESESERSGIESRLAATRDAGERAMLVQGRRVS